VPSNQRLSNENAVNARQQFGGEFVVSAEERDPMVVLGLDPVVAVPAIGVHFAARLDRFVDELLQTFGAPIGNSSHPDSANSAPDFFRRDHDERFPRRGPPSRAAKSAYERLVDFDASQQPIAARPHHGAAEFVQPRPRGLITAESQHCWSAKALVPVLELLTPHMARNHIVRGVRVS
jgi:hypothetical protein